MNRFVSLKVLSVFLTASALLLAHSVYADTFPKPPIDSAISGPIAEKPKIKPGMPADVLGALERCFPDPRSGQMRCPSPGGAAAGPEGASCQTTAGAKGIWVKKDSAPKLVCAVPGEACYTGTGGIGKVWAAGDQMVCGAKGDYCVTSKGTGRVFVESGAVSCLALNDGCTCTNGTAGCKVVGIKNDYLSYACAKGYVSCPGSTTGLIEMIPSNGQSNGAVSASLQWTPPKVDATSVTCEYPMAAGSKELSYSIPCHGAYSYIDTNRWRACTDSYNRVTHQVACDHPGVVSVAADSVVAALGASATPSSSVVANFLGSANDSAREHAICNYRVDALTYSVKVPCKSPTKARGNDYLCN